ncbi:MAG: hypothetical protein M1828_001372 [Chrysothrix sp. TS-e1954]|nr:MAG: hypothetical protein M1828_001372 [Chrysothrix sp. TS-e1954]
MPDQQKYTNKLHDARVLVLGGTSGIGFSVAEATIEHGAASVIVSSSSADKISKTIERLKAAYPSRSSAISGHICDLADREKMETNVQALLKYATDNHTKKLDHVVFTAGNAMKNKPLVETSVNDAVDWSTVRFLGALMVAKHLKATSALKSGVGSSYTMTTGTVSQRPIDGWVVGAGYAAASHGLMRSLALDLRPMRVNLVSPGAVQTEMWDELPEESRKNFTQAVTVGTTTGEIASPEDVAEAYMYSMKDHNLTGSVLSTNGGVLLLGKGL